MPKADTKDIKSKYETALSKAKEENKPVALLLVTEEVDGRKIRYRLLIRPSGERIFHNFEIAIDDSPVTIQIPLIGNWEDALNTAEAILSNMSMEKFKEAKELVLKLQPQRATRRRAEEIE
jgi:hypothetical protein